jgi:phage-related protein
MTRSRVRIYREADAVVPLFKWLDALPTKVRAKCLIAIEQLELHGRDLRRPQVDYLRNGIYELRIQLQGNQYRILYGFMGKDFILLTHGLMKRDKVPEREIDLALRRLRNAAENPAVHLHEES